MYNFTAKFLIEAAASQAKKDALGKKYGLEASIIEILANVDPTQTGDYMEWLAREASRTHLPQRSQLPAITEMLNEYIKAKRNPEWTGEKNILNLSYDQFDILMQTVSREDYSKKQKVRDIEENAKKYISEGVKYLGKAAGCYIYQPITAVASAAMSEGTHWCTKSEETSRSYLSNGAIYVATKPEYQNGYGNDKYIQIYVSQTRIEAEDAEGKDLSSLTKRGSIYTEECFEIIQFLGGFDELVKEGLDNETIHLRAESDVVCHDCEEPIEGEDEQYEGNGNIYCANCYYANYSSCGHCGDQIDMEGDAYVSTGDDYLCGDCGRYCGECDSGYLVVGRHPMSFYDVKDRFGEEREICQNCYNENYFTCEKCDKGFSHDEMHEFNGESVCPTCFTEDWDEDVTFTLDSWIEAGGLQDIITKEVNEQAEQVFQADKQALVGAYFQKMQEQGYLYSWDDLDLQTALTFVWDGGITGTLKKLYEDTLNPINCAVTTLIRDMKESANPTEAWGLDEVMEWLEENGIVDGEKYEGYNYI